MDNATPTARQIIEARIGRPLGPIATMPRDLRRAMSGLGKALLVHLAFQEQMAVLAVQILVEAEGLEVWVQMLLQR